MAITPLIAPDIIMAFAQKATTSLLLADIKIAKNAKVHQSHNKHMIKESSLYLEESMQAKTHIKFKTAKIANKFLFIKSCFISINQFLLQMTIVTNGTIIKNGANTSGSIGNSKNMMTIDNAGTEILLLLLNILIKLKYSPQYYLNRMK